MSNEYQRPQSGRAGMRTGTQRAGQRTSGSKAPSAYREAPRAAGRSVPAGDRLRQARPVSAPAGDRLRQARPVSAPTGDRLRQARPAGTPVRRTAQGQRQPAGAYRAPARPVQARTRSATENGVLTRLILIGVLCVALIVFSVLMITGDDTKRVAMDSFRAQYAGEMTALELTEADGNRFLKNLDLDPAQYGEWVYYTSDSLMEVTELLVLRCEDRSALETARAAVEKRLAAQKKSFEGYGTNQTELLNKAVLKTKGDYLFYAVGSDADKWEEGFSSLIR